MARTDAESARLLTSDIDERDRPFLTGERTAEGFHRITGGIDCAIARGLAYAPYADLIWCETSTPDLDQARRFAEGIRRAHPAQLPAFDLPPSFNGAKPLDADYLRRFPAEIAPMAYRPPRLT